MSKPNVLILGGCGFVGRNLVKHLVEGDLCAFIRVADKAMPATANMTPEYEKLYDAPMVEYRQCNLTNPASIAKMFAEDKGPWNFVINLAAETKYGQPEASYKERVLDLGVKCAQEAAKHKIDCYIDFSTAQVYEPGKKLRKEDGKIKPWTTLAKYSLQKEQAVQKTAGLPWIILRPAIIYGPCDCFGIMPRLMCGAVYKFLKEPLKFLWDSDLRINTVHVRDVVRAVWFLCTTPAARGRIFNLADHNDTTQGKVNKHLEAIFGIKTGFQNAFMNTAARIDFTATAEMVNDKHLQPWSDLCRAQGIDTQLSPFIDAEILYDNALPIDGTTIESLGFQYAHPTMSTDLVQEQIDFFVAAKQFPKM